MGCLLEEMDAYMHGNTIPCTLEKGYYALCFQDIPFGFGKCDGQMMKNKIPKGLRFFQFACFCRKKTYLA